MVGIKQNCAALLCRSSDLLPQQLSGCCCSRFHENLGLAHTVDMFGFGTSSECVN